MAQCFTIKRNIYTLITSVIWKSETRGLSFIIDSFRNILNYYSRQGWALERSMQKIPVAWRTFTEGQTASRRGRITLTYLLQGGWAVTDILSRHQSRWEEDQDSITHPFQESPFHFKCTCYLNFFPIWSPNNITQVDYTCTLTGWP